MASTVWKGHIAFGMVCFPVKLCAAARSLEFVPAAEVDPVYLDASYYVVPEAAGLRPYTLLFQTMRQSDAVALAQWTADNREHIVRLRPRRSGLVLHTLYYHDEVRALRNSAPTLPRSPPAS